MSKRTFLTAIAAVMLLASCGGSPTPAQNGGDDDGERFPAPKDFTVQAQVSPEGFDTLIFTYSVPDKVKAMKDVDFHVAMRVNGGEWTGASDEYPDPGIEPFFVQEIPGRMVCVFTVGGQPAKMDPGSTYEFRSCFAIGNMDGSAQSETVTLPRP